MGDRDHQAIRHRQMHLRAAARRWLVERTFAWLGRNRRLAKDFEATLASSTAWLFMASVQLMTRRLATL
ncbi:transposase [Caulobacter sp. DWR2-3-1b2]|uniref:transposase n=1 Tax=Caulobacter sp. DWR2-3-1b2 TaxID=2804642 RepID=UPI003CF83C13